MTTGQFDIVLGGHDADVTAFNGGSIGSSGVRVIVDDTNCRKKEDAIQGINYILNRIKEGTWPPTIFSPLSLFAAGEQGAWYDPSDMTTLFQDSAGTVPVTASGDPVGLMLDKSGRGNHAAQTTAGSRPTFRDVGGLRYLEFDGTDDFLVTAAINFTSSDEMSVFTGMRKTTDAAIAILAEISVASNNNNSFAMFSTRNIAAGQYGYRSGGTITQTADTSVVFPAPRSDVLTGLSKISTDTLQLRVGGVVATLSALDQGTGTFGTHQLFIGRRGGTSMPFAGNLYGLAVRGALTAGSSLSSMEAYMGNKTGLTLP